jgi:hypothetical protein
MELNLAVPEKNTCEYLSASSTFWALDAAVTDSNAIIIRLSFFITSSFFLKVSHHSINLQNEQILQIIVLYYLLPPESPPPPPDLESPPPPPLLEEPDEYDEPEE